jgi:trehalose-6-phosphatase
VPLSPPWSGHVLEISLPEISNAMKKLIVFDLDGTLAESKASIDAEMAKLLDLFSAS